MNVIMDKLIRKSKVAVLTVGSDHGGFYSINNNHKELLFHPLLVDMVEKKRSVEIDTDWIKQNLGIDDVDCSYANVLTINWIPVGTVFEVTMYSGSEVLNIPNDLIVA